MSAINIYVGNLSFDANEDQLVKEVQASTKKAIADIGAAFKEGYYGLAGDDKKTAAD